MCPVLKMTYKTLLLTYSFSSFTIYFIFFERWCTDVAVINGYCWARVTHLVTGHILVLWHIGDIINLFPPDLSINLSDISRFFLSLSLRNYN